MAAGTKRKVADTNLETSSHKSKSKSKAVLKSTTSLPASNKKEKTPDDEEATVIPSVKDLASSDPKLRRHALQKIMSHLQARPSTSQISSTEALQLWRGFSVALYMHDSKSAISVQNLITDLAGTFDTMWEKDLEQTNNNDSTNTGDNTIEKSDDTTSQPAEDEWNGLDGHEDNNKNKDEDEDEENEVLDPDTTPLPTTNLTTWSTSFWTTMIREWSTIDSHRMNKYLLLVRMVLRQIFTIVISSSSSPSSTTTSPLSPPSSNTPTTGTTQTQIQILSLHPLHPRTSSIPNGLRLHLIDIYVDELDNAFNSTFVTTTSASENKDGEEGADTRREELKREMLAPLRLVAKCGLVKVVRVRAREELARV